MKLHAANFNTLDTGLLSIAAAYFTIFNMMHCHNFQTLFVPCEVYQSTEAPQMYLPRLIDSVFCLCYRKTSRRFHAQAAVPENGRNSNFIRIEQCSTVTRISMCKLKMLLLSFVFLNHFQSARTEDIPPST